MWYRPEQQPGRDKLDPKWKGPGLVLRRVGAHSYVVQMKPGAEQEAHRSQLRPHVEDTHADNPFPLHYFMGKAPTLEMGPDEWLVESIDGHRMGPGGQPEFLVCWKDWDPTDRRWEPCPSFFPAYNEVLVDYCRKHGITLDLAQALAKPGRPPKNSAKPKGKARASL